MAVASGAESTQMMPRVSFAEPLTARTTTNRRPVAIVGTVVVVVGVATQLIAILAANWWSATVAKQQVGMHFGDFGPRAVRGFAFMYFTWGAWLIAGVTLGLGLAACVRWRGAHAFRIVAAVFGVGASVAPIVALVVFAYQAETDLFQVVRDYALGPYLAVLGTLATAFGAVAGSAR
jgi:hypothetical protein